jgi:hypothetical protein
VDVNMALRILQDATWDIELVHGNPRADWSTEYTQVLKAFAALDAWISQGKPLPLPWAIHHATPMPCTTACLLPRPRQEPRP